MLKTWQKIFSAAVAALAVLAVFYLGQGQKACCVCDSFRYHAPCLIDLETGTLTELDLYLPHETKVAELADVQPEQGAFSFVILGNVSGYKDTAREYAQIDVPIAEKTVDPALCKNCRRQLDGIFPNRYVLADLYGDKKLIPIRAGLSEKLRCYEISVREEQGVLKVTIQGTFQPTSGISRY